MRTLSRGGLERLRPVLDVLTDDEVETLDRLVGKLLAAQAVSVERAYAVCRLCATETCVPFGCPVEEGSRAHT